MEGQRQTNDPFDRDFCTSNSNNNNNYNYAPSDYEFPSGGFPVSALDCNGLSFMSMLFQPSPLRCTPDINMYENPPQESNYMHGSFQSDFFSTSQMGNLLGLNTRSFLEDMPFENVNTVGSYYYEHATMVPNLEPYSSSQLAPFDDMDQGFSPNFDHHMTVTYAGANYTQAVDDVFSMEGIMFGGGIICDTPHVELTPFMSSRFVRESEAAFRAPPVERVLSGGNYRVESFSQVEPQAAFSTPPVERVLAGANLRVESISQVDAAVSAPPVERVLAGANLRVVSQVDAAVSAPPVERVLAGGNYRVVSQTYEPLPSEPEDEENGNTEDEEEGEGEGEEEEDDDEAEDNMDFAFNNWSYEDLMAMQEQVGFVGTGLEEDEILEVLMMEEYPGHLVDADAPSCSICLDELEEGHELGVLDCRHKFHYECIKEWLMQNNSCPLCRMVTIIID